MPADLSAVHPLFLHVLNGILADLRALGWQPIVAEAVRTPEQQAVKVKDGHSKTMHSWHVPSTTARLAETRNSYSIVRGAAADIVDRRYGWGGPAKSLTFKFWTDLGRISKQHGCEWGGDWKSFPDVAHVQWLFIEGRPIDTYYA